MLRRPATCALCHLLCSPTLAVVGSTGGVNECDSLSRRDPLDTSPGVGGSGEGARNPSRGTGGVWELLGIPPTAGGVLGMLGEFLGILWNP